MRRHTTTISKAIGTRDFLRCHTTTNKDSAVGHALSTNRSKKKPPDSIATTSHQSKKTKEESRKEEYQCDNLGFIIWSSDSDSMSDSSDEGSQGPKRPHGFDKELWELMGGNPLYPNRQHEAREEHIRLKKIRKQQKEKDI